MLLVKLYASIIADTFLKYHAPIDTYGGGTSQVGVAGSTMFDTGVILTPSEITKIINNRDNENAKK